MKKFITIFAFSAWLVYAQRPIGITGGTPPSGPGSGTVSLAGCGLSLSGGGSTVSETVATAAHNGSYAILTGDCGKSLTTNTAAAWTIAQAGTTGFEAGKFWVVNNVGSGSLTVTATTSTFYGGPTANISGSVLTVPANSSVTFASTAAGYQVTDSNGISSVTSSGASGTVQLSNGSGGFSGAVVGSTSLDGSVVTAQFVAAPATTPTVALAGAGAGNLSNGSYIYVITYLTATGETDGTPVASCGTEAVTVVDHTTNGKVSLTSLPIGPAGVTGRRIYRTPIFRLFSGGFSCFGALKVADISDNVTTSYVDNTADAALTDAYTTVNTTGYALTFSGNSSGLYPSNTGPAGYTDPWVIKSDPNNGDFVAFVDWQYGYVGDFEPLSDSDGGMYWSQRASGATNSLLINPNIFGSGAMPSGRAAIYLTTYYAGTDNWANKVGAPLFGIDVDYAARAGDGFPYGFAVYNAEDGSHFAGGFSHAGAFTGVNMWASPTDSMMEVAGTVFPDKAVQSIRAAASQSAPLLKFKASNDADFTTGHFEKDGSLSAGAIASDPGCATTADIGKFWFNNTTTTTAAKKCVNIAGTLTWVAF